VKLFKTSAAALLLTFGLSILVIADRKLDNEHTPPGDREELKATIVIFGLPMTVLGSILGVSLYREGKQNQFKQIEGDRRQIQEQFYQVLQANQGRISIMQLAMAAKLPGREAKAFLDERAKEFNANFEVTPEGDIYYKFDL